jgi:hypothetical protein
MTTNAVTDRRERFRALHAQGLVVMPNAWDIGSGRTLITAARELQATGTYSYLHSAVPGTELEKALAAGRPRD